MASGLNHRDRRGAQRVVPERTPWRKLALLRPGQEVVLVNLSTGGVLVESPTRLAPGSRTELHLFGSPRRAVRGRIERCRVSHLEPLRYEGAIVFDVVLDLAALANCHWLVPQLARDVAGRESVTQANAGTLEQDP